VKYQSTLPVQVNPSPV